MKADIEERLANAISNKVPDVLDGILSKCEEQNKNFTEISMHSKKSGSRKRLNPILTAAAVITLLAGAYFAVGQYRAAHTEESVVYLDVNPSFELKANKNETVLSVKALNEDGEFVLSEIEREGKTLKGKALDKAAAEIVYTIADAGYLSGSNAVLVSVDSHDEEKGEEIKTELVSAIKSAMSEKGIDGAVMGQNGFSASGVSDLAEKYKISEGKAALIEKIIEKDPELTFDVLAKLKLSDLYRLAENWLGEIDISRVGTAADYKFVTPDSAVERACSHADIEAGDNAECSVSADLAEGKLVYHISIKTEGIEYECQIDAETGAILNWVSNMVGDIVQDSGTGTGKDSAPKKSNENQTNPPEIPGGEIINGIFDFMTKAADEIIKNAG